MSDLVKVVLASVEKDFHGVDGDMPDVLVLCQQGKEPALND